MSRFFAQIGDSDTESSSSDSEIEAPVVKAPIRQYSSILEESDEEKRVVRSSKDKRFSEINETIKAIRNHKKIKDIAKIQEGFISLCTIYAKSKGVIDKSGCPRAFIRCIADLETYIQEIWDDKEGRKKLNRTNSRALGALRQNVRKYNRDFTTEIEEYQKDPESYEEVIEEDEELEEKDESDDDDFQGSSVPSASKFSGRKPRISSSRVTDGGDSDEDSDDIWSDSYDESSSEDDVPAIGYTAAYFLKRKDDEKKDKPDKRKKAPRVQAAKASATEEEDGWTIVSGFDKTQKEKPLFEEDTEITVEIVNRKIAELSSIRGRRGANRQKNIETFETLSGICVKEDLGIPIVAKCMYYTCLAIFDYNPNLASCMKVEIWVQLLETFDKLLSLLEEHREVHFVEGLQDEEENLEDATKPLTVAGSILVTIERTDDEFTKLLRNLDPHGTEYVDRLADESKLCALILRVKKELEQRRASHSEMCRVYLREVEHLYYKYDYGKTPEGEENCQEKMNKLCKYIYRYDTTDRIRTRAMLCHIYHHALHNRWTEGRDLMLMSHLQQSIAHADIPTKILHNRTMVQLGLCAFRNGYIQHAHTTLNEIQSSQKSKELLAQGLSTQRMSERNLEQEKIEKQRQIPFHMHINLELLEYSYLTCAMLLEVPQMAAHESEQRKKLSRTFHYQLRNAEKSPLIGPPDSMREHLVAAAKAMMKGNWKKCADTLLAHKIWNLMTNAEEVKEMLKQKIKEESLRTYMFTYSACYDSISPIALSKMFELTNSQIHALLSKMILNDELKASWDKPTDLLILHRAESSKLQSLAKQTADKLNYVMENTEKMIEQRVPSIAGSLGNMNKGPIPTGLPWQPTWSTAYNQQHASKKASGQQGGGYAASVYSSGGYSGYKGHGTQVY